MANCDMAAFLVNNQGKNAIIKIFIMAPQLKMDQSKLMI